MEKLLKIFSLIFSPIWLGIMTVCRFVGSVFQFIWNLLSSALGANDKALFSHSLYLKWWLFVLLILSGVGVSFSLGYVSAIWIADFTHISLIIVALFMGRMINCGIHSWRIDQLSDATLSEWGYNNNLYQAHIEGRLYDAKVAIKNAMFVGFLCTLLGFVGTLCGFMVLSGAFSGVDPSIPAQTLAALSDASLGMSTAIYTTLLGTISVILLRIQCYFMQRSIEDLERKVKQSNPEHLIHTR